MKKYFIGTLLVIIVLAGILFVARSNRRVVSTPSISGFDRPLIVGVTSWPGYAGGILANRGFQENTDSIYTDKYGLKVRFVLMEDIDARGKAFAKGGPDGVDVVWSTIDFWANELPNFIGSGVEARAFMQADWSRGADALVAEQAIQKVEDLRGKKLALVQFTPSHWLLETALRKSSLTEDEREAIRKNLIFSQDASSARAAFVAGQVDAAVIWEPDVTQALKRSQSHVVISTKDFPELIADVMVAKKEFIEQHPQVLEAFVRGWFDGVEEARKYPERAAQALIQDEPLFADLGLEKTKESLSWAHRSDLGDNVRLFGLDGKPALFDSLYTEAMDVWLSLGAMKSGVLASQAKDDSILRRIYTP